MSFLENNIPSSKHSSQKSLEGRRRQAQKILQEFLQLRGNIPPEQWQPTDEDFDKLYKQAKKELGDAVQVKIPEIIDPTGNSIGEKTFGIKVLKVAIVLDGQTLAEEAIFKPPQATPESPHH